MIHRILSTRIASDQGLVWVRDRTRQVGEVFGLDDLQRTRLITAVSEIARNAVDYAGAGDIAFFFKPGEEGGQAIAVVISDDGPGIEHLAAILDGTAEADGRTMLGIAGSRRLVDGFDIQSAPGKGTTVTLEVQLRPSVGPISGDRLAELVDQLAQRKARTPAGELEQQNREMLHALEQLRLRQTELERADERKDEFLAMLAHELRNPLSAIGTALELLKRKGAGSEKDFRYLTDVMGRQTHQLAKLVNDLLDVSRVTRGKIDLSLEALPIADLIDDALETAHGAIAAKGHTLRYARPPQDIWVHADRVRFRQILGNLLHNAARYTPAGGTIRVTVEMDASQVRIAIEDNGIGIESEMLGRVFDLFTQANTCLARQDAGLGIGLTLVRRLLDAHGGSVEVASPGLGKGSTFTVTMPLTAMRQPVQTGAPGGLPASGRASKGMRVLLIDDNADALDALRMLLEDAGYEVAHASNGERGVALVTTFAPHLAIIDVGLPGMDGFAVARALRGTTATAGCALVALSGYTATSMIDRGREAGFDHYLSKPVEISRLEALLAQVARQGSKAASDSE